MIQKEKLVQFYFSQYSENAKKYKKKYQDKRSSYEKRLITLGKMMRHTHLAKNNQVRLEDYHRQIRNLSYYAFRENNPVALMQLRQVLLPELVRMDLEAMKPEELDLITTKLLEGLRADMPYQICKRTLKELSRSYLESDVRKQIIGMVPANPELEFPQALEKKRNFVLHVGPTNCGKTFHALERLKTAQNGVYLGPLRLLALEVYEKMKEAGVPCTMLTGEECIAEEHSRVIASTIEMLDIDQSYDIAVVDEAQMIASSDRGHSWTRALLGLQASEIHVCMSPSALKVILHLIELTNDTYEIKRYERKTALVCEDTPFSFPEDVTEGDALILFTKRAVLDIAGRLEKEGVKASVIYGSLPPEIRRRQIHQFAEKKSRVVVSTDAIGMGLNLPVKRIVFVQTEKFDGTAVRALTVPEIRQIAGRAGRFGIYDTGYISAMGEGNLRFIQQNVFEEEPEIEKVSLGFPRVLLDMDEPLDVILKIWKSVETSEPFEKIHIDDILFLYERAHKERKEIDGFEDKHTLYRMLTCSIDIKNKDIVALWLYYCKTYSADVSLTFPDLGQCSDSGLAKYETYYKMLDLYHQFSSRLGKNTEAARLEEAREATEEHIMRYLAKDKKNYIQKCRYCGRTLPVGYEKRICDRCNLPVRRP